MFNICNFKSIYLSKCKIFVPFLDFLLNVKLLFNFSINVYRLGICFYSKELLGRLHSNINLNISVGYRYRFMALALIYIQAIVILLTLTHIALTKVNNKLPAYLNKLIIKERTKIMCLCNLQNY